jgi:hypothetical protein
MVHGISATIHDVLLLLLLPLTIISWSVKCPPTWWKVAAEADIAQPQHRQP